MASYDIATLDEVKNFMGINNSKSNDDDLLENLITRVTEWFQNYCGVLQFKQQTYTDYYGGKNTRHLYVDNPPIISVTSLHDDTDWTWDAATLIDSGDYKIVNSFYVVLKDTTFSKGDQNIKIVYEGGHTTIPEDLKHACITEVSRIYNSRDDLSYTSKSSGAGSSISYDKDYLLSSTINILRKYRIISAL